jgi:hypothetical protein
MATVKKKSKEHDEPAERIEGRDYDACAIPPEQGLTPT